MIATGYSRGRGPRRAPARLAAVAVVAAVAAASLVGGSGLAGAAPSQCPDSNRPNTLTVVGGSPQTAQLGKPFQTNLQAALANTNGCPLTGQLGGYSVNFNAPASGASGTFANSGSNTVTVGTDASGTATAPTFTANDTTGSYSVHAESDFGSTNLYLTNTASGLAASSAATGATAQEAGVNSRYGQPLQAQVLDANGRPVQGVAVSFALGTGPYGASASFPDGSSQATETSDGSGRASSPPLEANSTAGSFTATASVSGGKPLTFRLENLAGPAATIAVGAADGESTPVGSRFPIRLAVTITDKDGNPVHGIIVTFSSPTRGPSGRFNSYVRGRTDGKPGRHGVRLRTSRTVRVKADGKGIAIAAPFTANRDTGGYVVVARAGGRRAAFALVNTPR
jgi:protocatechuate 3,4-dioxygenase beta subunit